MYLVIHDWKAKGVEGRGEIVKRHGTVSGWQVGDRVEKVPRMSRMSLSIRAPNLHSRDQKSNRLNSELTEPLGLCVRSK